MRTALQALLVTVAAFQAISAPAYGQDDEKRTYVFEGDGRMVGQPPRTVTHGETVKFAVIEDEAVAASQRVDVVTTLTGAIEGIQETLKERMLPGFLTLGLTDVRLTEIRDSYCRTALTIVATLEASAARDTLEQRLFEACPSPAAAPIAGLLPDFGTGAASYRMVVGCRDVGKQKGTIAATNPAPAGYTEFIDTAPCGERSFEVRLDKPIAAAVDKWAATHAMPQAIRLSAATARASFKSAAAGFTDRIERFKVLRECLRKAEEDATKKLLGATTAAQIDQITKDHADAIRTCTGTATLPDANTNLLSVRSELDTLNTALSGILSPLTSAAAANWVESWLWLTGGRPTLHPLAADTITPLNRQLTTAKEDLAKVEAELATLDKLTAAGIKIDNTSTLSDAVTKLAPTRATRDKLVLSIADLTKKIAAAESARLRDSFLYEGFYFVSADVTRPIRMQHHDAFHQYAIMGTQLVEVTENERVQILAENASPSSVLKLVQTVTPITNDRTKLVDELRLTSGQAAPAGIKATLTGLTSAEQNEAVVAAAASVAKQYDLLARGVAFAELEITAAPALVRFTLDESPARVTRLIPQDPPRTAPADVAYTIKETVGAEDKEVGKGGYRRNRLYRVRFKTGLLYSTLEKTNIATNATTSERTEEVSQHGVDALFGVSTYLGKRRDPRTIDSFGTGAWSLLTGLTVRDPTENLLVGIGFEPYGGVTLTFGGHVGRSERIRTVPGEPSAEDEWRARPFFGITFDVDFLKQLFSIKPSV